MSSHPCTTPAGMMMMSPGFTAFFTTSYAMPLHVGPFNSGEGLGITHDSQTEGYYIVSVGEHHSTAGDDVVAFGLRIVSDAPGRPASRSSRHLAPAWCGGRSCGIAPAGSCCVSRCPRGRNRDAIHCLPAMNDADGEVLVSDIDGFDVPIDSLSL